MRSVSVRACCAALLLLLVLSSAGPAFAGEPSDPVLQGRIHVPGGLTAEQEDELALWDFFLVWLQTRIQPPVG